MIFSQRVFLGNFHNLKMQDISKETLDKIANLAINTATEVKSDPPDHPMSNRDAALALVDLYGLVEETGMRLKKDRYKCKRCGQFLGKKSVMYFVAGIADQNDPGLLSLKIMPNLKFCSKCNRELESIEKEEQEERAKDVF